jgi:hypothetical protein
MAISVPATDIVNTLLVSQIAQVQALVNAPTINPAQNQQNLQTLTTLQEQLVCNLMANFQNRVAVLGQTVNSWINPATVISTLSINA